jgi:D-alanine transaminase
VAEVYFNGAFVPLEEARVSVMDRGFLFGDGVYEVIPAYDGHPRRLAAHLARLARSLEAIGLPDPVSPGEWRQVLGVLLAGGGDRSVYIQVTRGAAPERDHRFPAEVRPTVLAMARPMRPRRADLGETGVAAVTRADQRWHRCDIKATALLAAVLVRQDAAEAGAEEAILVRDGRAVEGSSSNVFLVRDGAIDTPPLSPDLLAGVTRGLVLELAQEAGIPCRERDIRADELAGADELWITSSLREVLPVTRLDGNPVGPGVPGPLWGRMDALYQRYKERLRAGNDD